MDLIVSWCFGSRFHQLPEFDQGKRSCRRRLACHNERRRKPPSGSLFSTHYGSLSSSIFGLIEFLSILSLFTLYSKIYALLFSFYKKERTLCWLWLFWFELIENNSSKSGSFLLDFSSHPHVNESSWPTRASEQGWDHQSTASGKFLQRPWLNNSENATSEFVLQGSATRTNYPGPGVPSGECFSGVSDSSTGALSLLSNRSWGSRNPPSSLGANIDGIHTIQPSDSHGAPTNHFSSPSLRFKGNEASSSSHEMPSDLGLGQISQAADDQYCGELGIGQQSGRQNMELDHSNGYHPSVQNVHWTLWVSSHSFMITVVREHVDEVVWCLWGCLLTNYH